MADIVLLIVVSFFYTTNKQATPFVQGLIVGVHGIKIIHSEISHGEREERQQEV